MSGHFSRSDPKGKNLKRRKKIQLVYENTEDKIKQTREKSRHEHDKKILNVTLRIFKWPLTLYVEINGVRWITT